MRCKAAQRDTETSSDRTRDSRTLKAVTMHRVGLARIVYAAAMAICLSGAVPAPAWGQSADDIDTAALRGATARGQPSTLPVAAVGGVGGVLIGIGASQHLGSQSGEAGMAIPLAGLVLVASGALLGELVARERSKQASVGEASLEEQLAHRRAFHSRAQRRWRDSLVIGAVTGVAVGVWLHCLGQMDAVIRRPLMKATPARTPDRRGDGRRLSDARRPGRRIRRGTGTRIRDRSSM
ncbi:hypothetical protein BH23GEM9_BH23GEM9_29610 [soil metagenome]